MIRLGFLLTALVVILNGCRSPFEQTANDLTVSSTTTGTVDRLAEPPLPDNPTPYEQGRHLYWLHCMPCHGDQGQGLTDEFRGLWVEDHQNCWGRGCHAGHPGDEGFPLPREIPAIINSAGDHPSPIAPEELIDFLHARHPPQDPGCLTETECRAVAAFVLAENQRLSNSR